MALQKVNYESQTDSYWVNLSPDEMKLIAAFLYNTRLGIGNSFKGAASNILRGIDAGIGGSFTEDAANEVGVYASLEDSVGQIGATIHSDGIIFEVTGGYPPVAPAALLLGNSNSGP